MELLSGRTDKFGGISVDLKGFGGPAEEFAPLLQHSVKEWESQGLTLVWLKLGKESAALLASVLAAGFEFYRCEPDSLTLTARLAPDAYVPSFTAHYVGAGGVVLSEAQELLVVLEKRDALERPGAYKLPGGLLESDEGIEEAVAREVLEETGVTTSFERLVGLGRVNSWVFGKPTLYFVCCLQPHSRAIILDEEEIAEAAWVPVDEFLQAEQVRPFNKRVVRAALADPGPLAASVHREGGREFELFLPSESAAE